MSEPILEDDALKISRAFDTATEADKPWMVDVLDRYKQQQDGAGKPLWPEYDRRRMEAEETLRRNFTDPTGFGLDKERLAELNTAASQTSNPDATIRQTFVSNFLAQRYGKDPAEVAANFPGYLSDYSRKNWNRDDMDGSAAFEKIAGEYALGADLGKAALKSSMDGEPSIQGFGKFFAEQKDKPGFNAARLTDYAVNFYTAHEKLKEHVARIRPVANEAFDILATAQTGDDFLRALKLVEPLNEADTGLVMSLMEKRGKEAPGKGIAEQSGEVIFRSVRDVWAGAASRMDKAAIDSVLPYLKAGAMIYADLADDPGALLDWELRRSASIRLAGSFGDTSGASIGRGTPQRKMTAAEAEAVKVEAGERIEAARTIKRLQTVADTLVDPVRAENFFTRHFYYPALESAGILANALLPGGVGLIANGLSYADDEYDRLRESGVSHDAATKNSLFVGAMQAGLDRLAAEVFIGKFPALKKVLGAPVPTFGQAAGRFGVRAAAGIAAETGIELVQDPIIPALVQDLTQQGGDVAWLGKNGVFQKAIDAAPQTAAAMMLLGVTGATLGAWRDVKNADALLSDTNLLKAFNVSDAQANAIRVLALRGDTGGAADLFREYAAPALQQGKTLSEAGHAAIQQMTERATKRRAARADMTSYVIAAPELHRTDEGYVLRFEDGTESAPFKNEHEADEARWQHTQDTEGFKPVETIREIFRAFERRMNVGDVVRREFELVPKAGADVTSEEQVKRRKEQDAALVGGQTIGNEHATAAALVAQNTSTNEDEAAGMRVLGTNQVEFADKVRVITTKLFAGGGLDNPIVALEEEAETDAKTLLNSGHRDWLRDSLREYEQVTGDTLFRTKDDAALKDDDLVEAYSHMAVAVFAGQSLKPGGEAVKMDRGKIRQLFRMRVGGAVNAMAQKYQAAFRRAAVIDKAAGAGKMNVDLTRMIAQSAGLGEQQAHEMDVVQEAQGIAKDETQKAVDSGASFSMVGADGFYSQLERSIEAKMPNVATVEQVKAIAGTAKAEELKWSGLVPWLEAQPGKVTKSDVLNYLRNEGAVKFEEHRGLDPDRKDPIKERPDFQTKFETYQLPGGENYREVVLAMPDNASEKPTRKEYTLFDPYGSAIAVGDVDSAERWKREGRLEEGQTIREQDVPDQNKIYWNNKAEGKFQSSHFPDVPNYVAHMRLSDRITSADGTSYTPPEPGLFIEEIQSDRHQQGRTVGYAGEPTISERGKVVPDAPFRTTWPLQMFKRALREAVETGKKWIGWTTGETQAERYDLSKQIDSLSWTREEPKEGESGGQTHGVLNAYKDGKIVISEVTKPEQIADYVGKEPARKLLEAPGATNGSGQTIRQIKGVELKVGGEGMAGFYDKILVKEVGKYVKQWGAGVERGQVGAEIDGWAVLDAYGRPINGDRYETEADARIVMRQRGLASSEGYKLKLLGENITDIHRVNITPEMVKGVEAGQPTFSMISVPRGTLEARVAALFDPFNRAPELRARLGLEMQRRAARLAREWAGRPTSPAVSRQSLELLASGAAGSAGELRAAKTRLAALDALDARQETELGGLKVDGADRTELARVRERQRLETARLLDSWRAQDATTAGKGDMLAALRTLDAITSALPPEVRAKVGGMVKLASLQTDEARLKEIARRTGVIAVELEKFLKRDISAQVEKLFDRYKPERDAGDKPKGKLGAEAQILVDAAQAAMDLSADETNAELARLDSLVASGNLSPADEVATLQRRGIVEQFGDWKSADAARMDAAFQSLRDMAQEAWARWKFKQLQKREDRQASRDNLRADTGKTGAADERDAALEESKTWFGKAKHLALSLSSFPEVLRHVFGKDSAEARKLADREREASNLYEDAMQSLADGINDFFATLAGSQLKGEKLRFDLSQPTITAQRRKLSQMQAIQAILMWAQEDGQRHMIGHLDENGKPSGTWNYDQAFADELDAQLTPEAREVLRFLQDAYAAEHAPLNALYRERHGISLPSHVNYAPITVKPQQAKAGEVVDPVSGAAVTGSVLTPSSLRTRSRGAIAEPRFEDALATFIGHTKQMEHWKAYYDFAVDAQAILGNRDVTNAVEARAGEQASVVLRKWIDIFAQGGARDAAGGLDMTKFLHRMAGRASTVALLGRVSTLLVQSTQLAAASVEMPVGSYLKRFGQLVTGQLDWSGAIKSDFIQRRIATMPPLVRQAMEGLASDKRPNAIRANVARLGNLLSGADALFTAGTYAMLLDFHNGNHAEAQRATERVAQPTRTGTRSLMEITATNPLAKAMWAFASEARQKIALVAWGVVNAKEEPARALKVAILTFVVGGLGSQILKNLWREAKGDDDEKKWSVPRLLAAMLAGPLQGVPGFSALMESGSLFSGFARGVGGAKNIYEYAFEGEERDTLGTMRDVEAILSSAGLFNENAAALAALAHLGVDGAKLLYHLTTGESTVNR